jgi:hypothetical protein
MSIGSTTTWRQILPTSKADATGRTGNVRYGVCAVVAVDGRIDHRDVFFSEAEKRDNRKVCLCVSRAQGVVTVDTMQRPDAA